MMYAAPPMGMAVPIGPGTPYMMTPGGFVQPPPMPPFSTSPGSHGMMGMAQMHGGGGVMHPGGMQLGPGGPYPHVPVGSPAPGGTSAAKGADGTPSKALKISTPDHKDVDLCAPSVAAQAAPAGTCTARGCSTARDVAPRRYSLIGMVRVEFSRMTNP